MPRYREKEKTAHTDKLSVFSLVFPLLSVLCTEGIFAFFSNSGLTVYKILFALAGGCFSVALSRLTPVRVINYLLQTVWLLFCVGVAVVQFLCFEAYGAYFSVLNPVGSLPGFSGIPAAAAENLPFLLCMAVPVLLQLLVQSTAMLRRRRLPGARFGANWPVAFGMLLLTLILSFVSVTAAFYADEGETSPRRQIEIKYMPQASAESFGILPQTALDFKFNVLHIAEEEVVRYYVVAEDGQRVELTEEEWIVWQEKG